MWKRKWILCGLLSTSMLMADAFDDKLEQIVQNRHDQQLLKRLLPIVHCDFEPSRYESLLMSQMRDVSSGLEEFRLLSQKISDILVAKVIECLPVESIPVQTPVTDCEGERLSHGIELVSVMRSGDALLERFLYHFPNANVSKFLIQRDEETALPHFKYLKSSSTIGSGNYVVITEPMIATGGTLEMVIDCLKEKGVREDRIIIASVCSAPEGLLYLSEKFPSIHVVMTVLDEKLNEKKYIVPGLGDFGDRYFGTFSH